MGRMRDIDPELVAGAEAIKRTDMLLRDARSVLRRVDALAATMRASEDELEPDVVLLRDGVEQVVRTLTFRKASGRRGMR